MKNIKFKTLMHLAMGGLMNWDTQPVRQPRVIKRNPQREQAAQDKRDRKNAKRLVDWQKCEAHCHPLRIDHVISQNN